MSAQEDRSRLDSHERPKETMLYALFNAIEISLSFPNSWIESKVYSIDENDI